MKTDQAQSVAGPFIGFLFLCIKVEKMMSFLTHKMVGFKRATFVEEMEEEKSLFLNCKNY